jgi:hypothetical protein
MSETNTNVTVQPIDTSLDSNLVLTTVDNPYNPKTDYDKWQMWDEDNGYDTERFVARLVSMEDGFDIDDEVKLNELTDKVIREILDNDVINQYMLI